MRIECYIPGQAVPQLRPRIVRKGQHYGLAEQQKVREWKAYVRFIFASEAQKKGWQASKRPIVLSLTFYMQAPSSFSRKKQIVAMSGEIHPTAKPDLDNLIKGVIDALNGTAWIDDSCIVELRAKKQYSETPGVIIEVEECNAYAALSAEPKKVESRH